MFGQRTARSVPAQASVASTGRLIRKTLAQAGSDFDPGESSWTARASRWSERGWRAFSTSLDRLSSLTTAR